MRNNFYKVVKIIAPLMYTAIVSVLLASCEKEEESIDCNGATPHYTSDVRPIINSNCLTSGCHNTGSKNGDYTSYDGLKTVALSGTLEKRLITEKTMPLSGVLSLEDRKKIKCWISSGAPNN